MGDSTANEMGQYTGAIGQALSLAETSEFFTWFHLARYEAPRAIGDGQTWHGYRPTSPKFHNLVTVNLETDRREQIDRLTLCLDRQFIESPTDAPFARDITRSFLSWALSAADSQRAGSLIDEIGDFRASPVPVIRHVSMPEPELPQFPSPAYRTFLGYQGDFDQELETIDLRFVNLNWQRRELDVATPPGYDGETKWFWLIVRRHS